MDLKNLVVCFIIVVTASAVKKYDGYKVYEVEPKTEEALKAITYVQNEAIGEAWSQISAHLPVKIMVAPGKVENFLDIMTRNDVKVTEVIGDLQRLIDNQMKPTNIRSSESFHSLNWNQYHDLTQIYAWLDEIAAAYPNIVSTVVMGQSVERREIKGVIINYGTDRNETLVGMIEGTLHAREWISAATVTWIIKEFLTSSDPEIRALAENFEWHIFPVVNPDGYSYTFTHNRMWRKNRSTASAKTCDVGVDDDMSNGVDLNRNFDFSWMTVGASNDSCTNTYAGPSPFSEPETTAIAQYVTSLTTKGEIIYYIAFHSYTQLIIVPYSNLTSSTEGGLPHNYDDMYEIARRGSESLAKRFGTTYRIGVSAEVMYPMSGTSFDWVKKTHDVPVCYLIELRDLGEFGFILPQEQIIPTGQEIMDALVEMDKTTQELGYYHPSSSAARHVISIAAVMASLVVYWIN